MNGVFVSVTKEKGVVRDDKIHGSLLVLNELLRVSNINWESIDDSLMRKLQWDQSQTNAVRYIFAKYHMVVTNLLWCKKQIPFNGSIIIMIHYFFYFLVISQSQILYFLH